MRKICKSYRMNDICFTDDALIIKGLGTIKYAEVDAFIPEEENGMIDFVFNVTDPTGYIIEEEIKCKHDKTEDFKIGEMIIGVKLEQWAYGLNNPRAEIEIHILHARSESVDVITFDSTKLPIEYSSALVKLALMFVKEMYFDNVFVDGEHLIDIEE